jgi:hypothetical protein
MWHSKNQIEFAIYFCTAFWKNSMMKQPLLTLSCLAWNSLDSNQSEISMQVDQLIMSTDPSAIDTEAFTLEFNALISQVKESFNSNCQTTCEECYKPFSNGTTGMTSQICGLFTSSSSAIYEFEMTNFTLDQILNGTVDPNDFAIGELSGSQCVQYSGGIYDDSEVCVLYLTTLPSQEVYCNITYNDMQCNSCSISSTTDCISADCTNVDATYGTMIDDCEGVGLDGPFQIITVINEADNSTFTTGSCDVDAPVKSPVVSPSAPTPTSNSYALIQSWSIVMMVMTLITTLP